MDVDGRKRLETIYRKTLFTPIRDGEGSLDIDPWDLSALIADAIAAVSVPAKPLEIFSAMGEAVARACNASCWVEKTPHHLLHLDAILEAAPTARIVVMLRDPECFVASYKHQGDRKDFDTKESFRALYHPAIAALVCRGYIEAATRAASKYPNNVKVVNLADLRAQDSIALQEVISHLALPEYTEVHYPESNSSFSGSKHRRLPEAVDLIWLHILAGRAARRACYQLSPAPFAPLGFLKSCLTLTIWPLRNFNRLRRTHIGPFAYLRRWLR